jgi:hypothetical protein
MIGSDSCGRQNNEDKVEPCRQARMICDGKSA